MGHVRARAAGRLGVCGRPRSARCTARFQLVPNRHYPDTEAYREALADALAYEYRAIADAGFVLQIDPPVLVADWDFWADDDVDAYRAVAARDVKLLNHARDGIPAERVRYHLCWGSWQGPHRSDLPLADIVDLMLGVRAGAYVIEAANPRHEHGMEAVARHGTARRPSAGRASSPTRRASSSIPRGSAIASCAMRRWWAASG